ncbi:two-component sensor histidine kinase [Sphingomonas vulcanisoli]|uniref:histidine kinase n=1 Tax=Sphingomonas vulcanisoli TaxID=1658060 RepID=A0ABX0TSZ5_9SPHN|nr:sensor histidine kinase [Sphingomonas vulcanisoli]NIJ07640.1 two-component sensor histidine kinase [Sphingomonas vulcanisoli]
MMARFSTGTKMLFIMTAALMPLGLIALFASIQSAHAKQLQHEADAQLIATAEARQIDLLLVRVANVVRFAAGAANARPERCSDLIAEADRLIHVPSRIALFDRAGRLLCASPGFKARGLPAPRGNIGLDLLVLGDPGGVRFSVANAAGDYGVGELAAPVLRQAAGTDDQTQGLTLQQGDAKLLIAKARKRFPLDQRITVRAAIAGGQATLALVQISSTISAIEVLLILLPLLMWAAAAGIGWVVINELLLRPLKQLQRAVALASNAEGPFVLPKLQTPAVEIQSLGAAFERATDQLMHREEALEDGLRRQVLLTREVHHRVKNNLQVVASLINLHARGSRGDVAAAYATIQRRVDALAVVHRNHFAELEKNRGVALRSIISELTANLRATAPPTADGLSITLDIAPVHVSQDTAVPVAFLVTEIIELLIDYAPDALARIEAAPIGDAGAKTMLSITAAALAEPRVTGSAGHESFERVVSGLSRQLRAAMEFDPQIGRYAIAIPTVPNDDATR